MKYWRNDMFNSALSKVLLGICLFVLFILLAIPSASLIMDYFSEKSRDERTDNDC